MASRHQLALGRGLLTSTELARQAARGRHLLHFQLAWPSSLAVLGALAVLVVLFGKA